MNILEDILETEENIKKESFTDYLYQNVLDKDDKIKDNAEKFTIDYILVVRESKNTDRDNIKKIIKHGYNGETLKKEQLIKKCTDNYNISMLKRLSEQIQQWVKTLNGVIWLVEEVFSARYEERGKGILSMPEVGKMLDEGKSCVKLKNELVELDNEINTTILQQESTATPPPPEPELIDFSKGTDTKTKLAILQELGIFDYLIKTAYPINNANKIASLLSAIIGGEAKTLQTYINPIISPDTDQRNAPKKIHKEKARQILQKLGYTAKKL